jgi:peptidoglycan-N-acetylglucosamine deacetylase
MAYRAKTPWWLKKLYRNLIWDMPASENSIYLTFDDGPHPEITPYVLQQLAMYNAKATFFCIGKNVVEHPDVFQSIVLAGHTVGNHTHNHMNGWSTAEDTYLANIQQAETYIKSRLFRPPYGRIKMAQAKRLLNDNPAWKIYMWDVLSADFDTTITPQQCADNVIENLQPGAIVVFHDSEKARERMEYALPQVLAFCKKNNWILKALPE